MRAKIITASCFGVFGMLSSLRSQTGPLDTGFGSGGIVTTPIGAGHDYGRSVAIQSDGKILVAGEAQTGPFSYQTKFALVRYFSNGSPDSGFGTGGKVTTPVGTDSAHGNAVALQADGKIVVAGTYDTNSWAVVRYLSNGDPDSSFGPLGIRTTSIGNLFADHPHSIAIQSDGKILVAGDADTGTSYDFALVRYNSDGTRDGSFGNDGIATVDFNGQTDVVNGLVLQPDGKIVVVGYADGGASGKSIAIARLGTSGNLDSSFNGSGKATTTLSGSGDVATSVVVQSDGGILIAGIAKYSQNSEFALVRYQPNGQLDTSFNLDGKLTTSIASNFSRAYGVALQSSGKIVVAGACRNGSSSAGFSVARYDINGNLDPLFHGTGYVNVFFASGPSGAGATGQSVAVQDDGKIVVAGYAYTGTGYDFAVVRYLPDAPAGLIGSVVHRVQPAAIANGTSSASVNEPLVPVTNLAKLADSSVTPAYGLVADGVTPLLLSLEQPDASDRAFLISIADTQGGTVTGGLESRLKVLANNSWTGVNGSGEFVMNLVEQFAGDPNRHGYAYLGAIAADELTVDPGSKEVSCKLIATEIDSGGNPTGFVKTVDFKIRKPPIVLIHGYNTVGDWGQSFVDLLGWTRPHDGSVSDPLDFVRTIHYGVQNGNYSVSTTGRLDDLAALLSEVLHDDTIETGYSSLFRDAWAMTRYDVIAHSQGGVLARMLSSANGNTAKNGQYVAAFRNSDNSFRGRFHRVITIGSPHNGSRLATYMLELLKQNPLTDFRAVVPNLMVPNLIPDSFWGLGAGLQHSLQSKFDPFDSQIMDLNTPGGRWTPDSNARFLLISTATTGLPGFYSIGLGDSYHRDLVIPQGSDSIVDWRSARAASSAGFGDVTGRNIAHADVSGYFGEEEFDVNSLIVAQRCMEALDGGYTFEPFPPLSGLLLTPADKMQISSAASANVTVAEVLVEYLLAPAPPATINLHEMDLLDQPRGSPVRWSVEVYSADGVKSGDALLARNVSDSTYAALSIPTDLVGDVVVYANYTTMTGGLVFGRAFKAASVAPSSAMTGLELRPSGLATVVGNAFGFEVWGNYADGIKRRLFLNNSDLNLQSSNPAVVEINSQNFAVGKIVGTAQVQLTYLGFAASMSVNVVAPSLAAIVRQPTGQAASLGSTVVLNVVADGGGGALSFQWRRNGIDLPSETKDTLTLIDVTAANSGVYTVLVSNFAGSVTSTSAMVTVQAPVIVVEQPAGTDLTDGTASVSFGGTSSDVDRSFTIRNVGTAVLTGLGISIDGSNAGDFAIASYPTAPVAPGGSTTFTIRFTPTANGVRTAALHVASNVTGSMNPFDINLTGTGLSNDANLSGLTLSAESLDPLFVSSTTSYTASVSNATTSLTVTAMVTYSNASVTVNGQSIVSGSASASISLNGGNNIIVVRVTAQDGTTTKDYTVTVNRAAFAAVYSSTSDIPIVGSSYSATGNTISFTLNYAPATGTSLMVVNNIGLGFISGAFSNLAQGQTVQLNFGGNTFYFVANYFGGTGNDLVLQWASVRAFSWGGNGTGQLGIGNTTQSNIPVAVDTTGVLSGRSIVSLAAGSNHSLALCSDGTIAAWGNNSFGQLGNGSTAQSTTPVAVVSSGALSGKTVVAVAAGSSFSLALCSDGTVKAWGNNSGGQLGTGGTTQSNVPVSVNATGVLAGRTVIAIAASSHSLALCSDGKVAGWGTNSNGQLGNGSTTQSTLPVAVNTTGVLSGKTVVAIAAGGSHSLALCSDGTVKAWGGNLNGPLGSGNTSNSSVPVSVSVAGVLSGKVVARIGAGSLHSLALCSDGTLATWGLNSNGQLGVSSPSQSTVPVLVNTTTGALVGKMAGAGAAGSRHSLALCADGTLATWGLNTNGQLGNDSTTQSNVPGSISNASLIAGERFVLGTSGPGSSHSLGIVASPLPPPAPQIAVEFLSGASLLDGIATVELGSLLTGSNTSIGFVIRNTGTANLTGLGITFDGANFGNFSVITSPATLVAPGNSTNFIVRFAPTAVGTKTAALHISSNAPGLTNPFDVGLTGTGITPSENWRLFYFGTTSNAGSAADTATPQNDGVNNLIKFATGMDPTKSGTMPGIITPSGNNLTFTYTPSAAAVADGVTFAVEYSDSLTAGMWLSDVVNQGAIGSGGSPVTATVPKGSGGHRFLHLKITSP